MAIEMEKISKNKSKHAQNLKRIGGNDGHHCLYISNIFQWTPLTIIHYYGGLADTVEVGANE